MNKHSSASLQKIAIFLAITFMATSHAYVTSATRYINFTSSYSAEWFTQDVSGTLKLVMTLRYTEYDITSWSSNGQNGIYLGVGFGSKQMYGADIVICKLVFTNHLTDTFVCDDRYGTGNSVPVLDQQRDTTDVSTNLLKWTDSVHAIKYETFEATFTRNLVTGDTYTISSNGENFVEDNDIIYNSKFSVIWSYGELTSLGNPKSHIERGASSMYFSSATGASFFTSALTLLALITFSTFSF